MKLSFTESLVIVRLLQKEIELKETDNAKYYDKLEKLVIKIKKGKRH